MQKLVAYHTFHTRVMKLGNRQSPLLEIIPQTKSPSPRQDIDGDCDDDDDDGSWLDVVCFVIV